MLNLWRFPRPAQQAGLDADGDGRISAPDMQRLNQRLNQDAEARRVFTEMLNLDSALAALAAAPVGSRHYVLVADTREAALAWWTPDGLRVDLTC